MVALLKIAMPLTSSLIAGTVRSLPLAVFTGAHAEINPGLRQYGPAGSKLARVARAKAGYARARSAAGSIMWPCPPGIVLRSGRSGTTADRSDFRESRSAALTHALLRCKQDHARGFITARAGGARHLPARVTPPNAVTLFDGRVPGLSPYCLRPTNLARLERPQRESAGSRIEIDAAQNEPRRACRCTRGLIETAERDPGRDRNLNPDRSLRGAAQCALLRRMDRSAPVEHRQHSTMARSPAQTLRPSFVHRASPSPHDHAKHPSHRMHTPRIRAPRTDDMRSHSGCRRWACLAVSRLETNGYACLATQVHPAPTLVNLLEPSRSLRVETQSQPERQRGDKDSA